VASLSSFLSRNTFWLSLSPSTKLCRMKTDNPDSLPNN
jgi:hypothetical protein